MTGLSAHQVRRSRRFRFRRLQPLLHRPADHPHGRNLPQLRRSQGRAGYADAGRHRSDDQETARSRRYAQSGHGSRQRQPRPVPFGPETGYPNVTGPNKGVLLEIRRERTIELLQEGHRYYDLIRWKEGKAFTQPLLGIYIPPRANTTSTATARPTSTSRPRESRPRPKLRSSWRSIRTSSSRRRPRLHLAPQEESGRVERGTGLLLPDSDRRPLADRGALTQNPGWNDGLDF